MNSLQELLRSANAALSAGNIQLAEQQARTVLEHSPNQPLALFITGMAAFQRQDNKTAIAAFKKVQKIQPGDAAVLNGLGTAYMAEGKYHEALDYFRQCCKLHPDYVHAFKNLGALYKVRGQLEEAEAAYCRSVALAPEFGSALNEWGFALQELGQQEAANQAFLRAAQSNNCPVNAYSNYLMGLNYCAHPDPEAIFAAHKSWGEQTESRLSESANAALKTVRSNATLKKIGYVSADFYFHSVAHFLLPVLRAHDRSKYQIYCYQTDNKIVDAMTLDLQAQASVWRDVSKLNDAELTHQIIADEIDILFDLSGHTGKNRLEVFARRAAPIQITWLGYPNTTGLSRMDYRISDAIADPTGTERFCTEKLLRLPEGFLSFRGDELAQIDEQTPHARSQTFTFGSFNNLNKVTTEVIDVWARLLNELPDSRLLLKSNHLDDHANKKRLIQSFEQRGIPAKRLLLVGKIKNASQHLQRYNDVDIALDPFPYGGTTTTCEALWMGVPVITLSGVTHASRVGASLLHKVGLDDLVAHTHDDYIAIARNLKQDEPRRSSLRSSLREAMKNSALGNAERFTRELERGFDEVWKKRGG